MSRSVLAELLSDQGLDIEDDIRELKGVRDYVVQSCLYHMKDLELPLDERWDIFLEIEEFLPVSRWIVHLNALEGKHVKHHGFSWYDDFHTERREEVLYSDVVERIEIDRDSDYVREGSISEWVDLDALKEEILQSGQRGFICDW